MVIPFEPRRFQHAAAEYLAARPAYSPRLFERIALLCALDRTHRVLDLGCGPGQPMAAYLVANGLDVCGVDSSPTMIAMARHNLPGRDFIVADMRTLNLGRHFAGILAWDSFFHLTPDDQRRMFPIFRDHAKPGAPLMFTSGPRHGEAIGHLRGEPLYHASLAPEAYRTLLAAHGFAVIAERMEDPDCGGHSVWLARRQEDG